MTTLPTEEARLTLLTAREAAEYLRVSLSTLRRMESRGHLASLRTPGGHRRYSLQMLNACLTAVAGTVAGAAPAATGSSPEAEEVAVYLTEPDSGELALCAVAGVPPGQIPASAYHLQLGTGAPGRAALSGKNVQLTHPPERSPCNSTGSTASNSPVSTTDT